MKNTSSKFSRVDTLIITVGTRQVGWRCSDRAVRCMGTDGDRGAPAHIDELYREIGIERSYHQENNPNSRWGVRDLGERCYKLCVNNDFTPVELLLDHKIIADSVRRGLKHVILWGTNQPDSIPWNFRRNDTLWLARLMAGKIRSKWPDVKVDIWPDAKTGTDDEKVLAANNIEKIRSELEDYLLPYIFQFRSHTANQFILAIQNKGALPTIANGLEICAAALVRQCQVLNFSPIEPEPLYEHLPNGFLSAQTSQTYQTISVGEYFWPLERMRVISAWKRGDFREAEIWLTSHQTRYEGVLYKLAGCLALSTNWQIDTFLSDRARGIESWLCSEALAKIAEPQQVKTWQEQLHLTRTHEPAMAWETNFLIYLLLQQGNYTNAFMQFSQTLERLLYLQYKSANWLSQGYVEAPNYLSHLGDSYQPGLKQLIDGWFKAKKLEKQGSRYKLLDNIRNTRNAIVHSAKATTQDEIISVWTDSGWPLKIGHQPIEALIMQRMIETLKIVCERDWDLEQTLLQLLYEWGLNWLQQESKSI